MVTRDPLRFTRFWPKERYIPNWSEYLPYGPSARWPIESNGTGGPPDPSTFSYLRQQQAFFKYRVSQVWNEIYEVAFQFLLSQKKANNPKIQLHQGAIIDQMGPLFMSKNVLYFTFVAKVTKNLSYALRENNSGSNSLRESSASCAGLREAIG